eukprot:12814029-Ditylum_brightwellii.AAC.1
MSDKDGPSSKLKRFLMAFNFLFMHEHALLLGSESESKSPCTRTLANTANLLDMKAKRNHVKTH